MAVRKSIWVAGDSLPTITNDIQNSSVSGTHQVFYNEFIESAFSMTTNANAYRYDDMSSISDYVVQSGDYLEYDVYWVNVGNIAFDFTCSDGTSLRTAGTDQNGVLTHPDSDLSSYALEKWYHRKISLASYVGKTIQKYDLACERNVTGVYYAYFKQIVITDGAGTTTSTSQSTSSSSTSSSTSQSTSTSSSISTTSSSTSHSTSTTTLITLVIPQGESRATSVKGNQFYFKSRGR